MYQILIVDDDRNYRYAVREVLDWEEIGFQIADEAIHGSQALRKMKEKKFDLVITDMSMPLMNGVELIKEAKKQFPDVLFVALSAYDDFEFVKESLKKGAVDYILKYEMQEDEIRKVILQVKELLDKKNLYEEKSRVLRSTSALSPEIRKALLYMQENYCEDIGLGEVADHVGLNKNYFSNLFKGETGENFVRYLNRLRDSKAAVLLEQKNMKIYEAAEKVGYHNANYLSRMFKEIMGLTVEEYKKSKLL